jgi:hypothetical protein
LVNRTTIGEQAAVSLAVKLATTCDFAVKKDRQRDRINKLLINLLDIKNIHKKASVSRKRKGTFLLVFNS